MQSTRRFVRHALSILALIAGLLILILGIAIRTGDVRLQTVLTGSMQPTFSPGDVAVTEPVAVSMLAVGDVIAFYPPDGQVVPVLHRIASIGPKDGSVAVTTKGDANRVADPWGQVTLRGDTAYRLVAIVPLIGWLIQIRGLLLIAAGVLVALVLLRELTRKETPLPVGPSVS